MLKGDLVILRGVTREDLPRLCEFANDVEFAVLQGDVPWRPASLERSLARYEDDLRRDSADRVRLAIEADGVLIGTISLRDINPTDGTAELGIGIGDREYWGRGYGRDAVQVILRYAFQMSNLHRVFLHTDADNERAIRCYRACGFVLEGTLRQHAWVNGKRVDVVCMGILRDEWETRREPLSP